MSNRWIVRAVTPLVVTGMLLVSGAWAQQDTIPLTNWTVPGKAGLTLSAMDLTNPLPFIGIAPCRVVDTRGNGFTGEWGPPNLTADQFRDFTIAGRCGIPTTASAVSFNFTVTEDPGYGFLRVYPTGGSVPVVSTLNWGPYETKANAAIVPLGAAGKITVNTAASGAAVIIDVNGYFGAFPAPGGVFLLFTQQDAAGLYVDNSDASCALGPCGILGSVAATGGTASAVEGWALGSSAAAAAGVYGQDGSGALHPSAYSNMSAGMYGRSKAGIGVEGLSEAVGVRGENYDSSGSFKTCGLLGFHSGGGSYYGVWSTGDYGGTGVKYFVEPHPTDPEKVIRYVALEGPEAGTYFRGRGRLRGGVARIPVPEDFRMVTAEEGLTVQVTPIGRAISIAVVSMNLDEIVLRGPSSALDDDARADVEFFYTVNGVRKAYKDLTPIGAGSEYMPARPDDRMPAVFPQEIRRRLIDSGIYNEDGTVNMETARALGWTKVWEERGVAAAQAAPRRRGAGS
jgi:hypothetical protein